MDYKDCGDFEGDSLELWSFELLPKIKFVLNEKRVFDEGHIHHISKADFRPMKYFFGKKCVNLQLRKKCINHENQRNLVTRGQLCFILFYFIIFSTMKTFH